MNIFMRSNPAMKHMNDVILSNAKNLAFSLYYEILHGACPELNYETLCFTQGDRRRVQDDNDGLIIKREENS